MKNLHTYDIEHLKKIVKKFKIVALGAVTMSSVLITNCGKEEKEIPNTYEKTYTSIEVEKGDTLLSIAKEKMDHDGYDEAYQNLNDYVEEVKSINQLPNDKITEGEYLVVPEIVSEEEIKQDEEFDILFYEVKPGDTLENIAHTFKDTVVDICRRNNIDKNEFLSIGTTLKIKTPKDLKNEYEIAKETSLERHM